MKQLCNDSCLQKATVIAQVKNVQRENYCAGFVYYCCIPGSKNPFTAFWFSCDWKRVKTGISLFEFPKDNTEKRR